MAIRAGMVNMIQRVRNHIHELDGDVFEDEEIQEALDRTQDAFTSPTPLMPTVTFLSGGELVFLNYWADFTQAGGGGAGLGFQFAIAGGHSVRGAGASYKRPNPLNDWEEDARLFDSNFLDITDEATPDYVFGQWVFALNQTPPVYIVGQNYDINAACADLLNQWATVEMLSFDASGDKVTGSRSQKFDMISKAAARFAAASRPKIIRAVRSDMRGY